MLPAINNNPSKEELNEWIIFFNEKKEKIKAKGEYSLYAVSTLESYLIDVLDKIKYLISGLSKHTYSYTKNHRL